MDYDDLGYSYRTSGRLDNAEYIDDTLADVSIRDVDEIEHFDKIKSKNNFDEITTKIDKDTKNKVKKNKGKKVKIVEEETEKTNDVVNDGVNKGEEIEKDKEEEDSEVTESKKNKKSKSSKSKKSNKKEAHKKADKKVSNKKVKKSKHKKDESDDEDKSESSSESSESESESSSESASEEEEIVIDEDEETEEKHKKTNKKTNAKSVSKKQKKPKDEEVEESESDQEKQSSPKQLDKKQKKSKNEETKPESNNVEVNNAGANKLVAISGESILASLNINGGVESTENPTENHMGKLNKLISTLPEFEKLIPMINELKPLVNKELVLYLTDIDNMIKHVDIDKFMNKIKLVISNKEVLDKIAKEANLNIDNSMIELFIKETNNLSSNDYIKLIAEGVLTATRAEVDFTNYDLMKSYIDEVIVMKELAKTPEKISQDKRNEEKLNNISNNYDGILQCINNFIANSKQLEILYGMKGMLSQFMVIKDEIHKLVNDPKELKKLEDIDINALFAKFKKQETPTAQPVIQPAPVVKVEPTPIPTSDSKSLDDAYANISNRYKKLKGKTNCECEKIVVDKLTPPINDSESPGEMENILMNTQDLEGGADIHSSLLNNIVDTNHSSKNNELSQAYIMAFAQKYNNVSF